LPRDWKDWYLHQYSADGNYKGSTYGVESAHVDLNRYRGSLADLRKFCGLDAQPVPAPDLEVDMLVVKTPLNLRTGQGTNHSVITTMPPGEKVELKEIGVISGGYPWLKVHMARLNQTGWCASVISGTPSVQVD
jgi:hypothetical protein